MSFIDSYNNTKLFISISSSLFSVVFVIMLYNIIFALIKLNKLKTALAQVSVNPNQHTADELLRVLTSIKYFQKFIITNTNESNGGISKRMCANTYMDVIDPCPNIDQNTKNAIVEKLVGIGCVFSKLSVAVSINNNGKPTQSVNNIQTAAPVYAVDEKEYGDMGEENVWFSLLQACKNAGCNAFFSTRFYCQNIPMQKSQEIDCIVVSKKGIFLIEVKSPSHKKMSPYDRSTVVVGSDIDDPSMQISMHKDAFLENISIDPRVIKNLLVISYPNNSKKRIDINSFPYNQNYVTLKVDELYSFILSYGGPDVMTQETVDSISAKLTSFINYKANKAVTKWIIDGEEGNAVSGYKPKPKAVPATAAPVQPTDSVTCPKCGFIGKSGLNFCPKCGNKF